MTALAVVVALGILLSACGASPTSPSESSATATLTPVASSADWPASSPDAEGLDATRLGDLALRIRRGDYGRVTSVLIARDGRLLFEEYFNGWSAAQAHTMQSVTKSVTSLLVGLAVQARRLEVNDAATSFFPQYQPLANLDDRKRSLTVRDLLTMRSGLDWSEDLYAGSPLQQLNDCRCDWLRFVLDWRMRDAPGTRWEYVSGGTILLGGIVGAATGIRLDQFAAAELFGPLGMSGASWAQGLPDGLPHAGGGLFLRPRDMAKLGLLIVDQGRWQGRQIVSPSWIRESTTRVTSGVRTWAGRRFDYAYSWWLLDHQGSDIVTAAGAQGQWIFAAPRDRLVVSVTSNNDDGRWVTPVDFLFSHILPAVR